MKLTQHSIKIILVIISCYSAYGQNPVAYFSFSGNANDSSGNNLHGTVVGAQLSCDRFGLPNSAYSFDRNDFIQVSHNTKLTFGANSFSLAAWIKFCNSQAEYAGIIAKGPTTIFYPGYQLTIASQNKLTTQIGDSSGYGIERRGRTSLDDGKWHFVVLNVSPTSSSQEIVELYVDGVLEAYDQKYTHKAGLDASLNYTNNLFIGKDRNSTQFFKGSIDDIRIYRGVLSDSLIQALYHENGWPNAVPSLKIIPNGPTEFCEGSSVTLTAPNCIRSYQWSNGATTSSIVATTSGIYRLTGYDVDGCVVTDDSITVKAVNCNPDTATGDFIFNIPSNCPGNSEQLGIPFVNTYYSDTLIGVRFSSPYSTAFSYNGSLPRYLPPTVPVVLPITFRWIKPGVQSVVMTLVTSSGRQHRILLKTPVGNAASPFLTPVQIRTGLKSAPFDTCITVNNLLDAGVTVTDTVWIGRSRVARLLSPAFPFYVGPKGAVQLCFRVEPSATAAIDTMFLAGANAPKNCLACFYQPIEVSTGPPRPQISSIADNNPVTGEVRLSTSVYPNPARGELTLQVASPAAMVVKVMLVDNAGRTVMEILNQHLYQGDNLIPVITHNITSGRYMLIVQSSSARSTNAITIQQ
ncbi:MAG: hypothetical protein JNJ94_07645 [Chlorobi bacterium]|nr:hypothetical protein [Chlorobiota bacterium]